MRQAEIYYNNNKAGILIETNDGIYTFQYDNEYIIEHSNDFKSLKKTIPMIFIVT